MKNIKYLFAVIIFAFLLIQPFYAQTATDNLSITQRNSGVVLRWNDLEIDSAGTNWSQALDLTNFDGPKVTISNALSCGGLASTTSGTPDLLITEWVCYADPTVNGNWIISDTVAAITDTVVFKGNWGTNNIKAPYKKYKAVNAAGGAACTLDFGIYFYKKD